jgi:hypothetical protein
MAVPERWLRRRVSSIPRRDCYFACRGFPDADPVKRQHRERIGRTFVDGYHATREELAP